MRVTSSYWALLFIACILFGSAKPSDAEEIKLAKPFVEAGVSGGLGYVPDYPAAAEGQFRYLVFPVFHIRGKVLRSDDEDGSRARLFRSTVVAFELSASGSFPTSSEDNAARQGMPDLEWLGELGPRIFAQVYSQNGVSLRTALAWRGAFSTDFKSGHYRGMTLTPGLAYDHKKFLNPYLTFALRLSPQFTSREMQSYFYDVHEVDARPDRPVYGAKAGYIGTSVTPSFWYERSNYGIFTGLSVSLHDGAANSASPLFKERVTYSGFLGFRWYFYKSAQEGYL